MLLVLSSQIRSLQRQQNEQAREIIRLLLGGAQVEPGYHSVEILHNYRGGQVVCCLSVDGKAFR
jgi:hypothetical protein